MSRRKNPAVTSVVTEKASVVTEKASVDSAPVNKPSDYCVAMQSLVYSQDQAGNWGIVCFLNRLLMEKQGTLSRGDVLSALTNLNNQISQLIKNLPK